MNLQDLGVALIFIGIAAALFIFLPWPVALLIVGGFIAYAVGERRR